MFIFWHLFHILIITNNFDAYYHLFVICSFMYLTNDTGFSNSLSWVSILIDNSFAILSFLKKKNQIQPKSLLLVLSLKEKSKQTRINLWWDWITVWADYDVLLFLFFFWFSHISSAENSLDIPRFPFIMWRLYVTFQIPRALPWLPQFVRWMKRQRGLEPVKSMWPRHTNHWNTRLKLWRGVFFFSVFLTLYCQ